MTKCEIKHCKIGPYRYNQVKATHYIKYGIVYIDLKVNVISILAYPDMFGYQE